MGSFLETTHSTDGGNKVCKLGVWQEDPEYGKGFFSDTTPLNSQTRFEKSMNTLTFESYRLAAWTGMSSHYFINIGVANN